MNVIRNSLGILLAILCLNAMGGGYYGMTGAEGVPLTWLHGSPFVSYFIPSLFLFLIIGGTCAVASVAIFRKASYSRSISFFCSGLLLAWIAAQLMMIGYVSWLQTAVIISALIIYGLAYFLKQPTQHQD